MNGDSTNITKFTFSEAKLLKELTSFDFGFIKFNTSKGQIKKKVLEKGILSLDTTLSEIVQKVYEEKEEEEKRIKESNCYTNSQSEIDLYEKYSAILSEKVDPFIYLYLGHFQLLLHLYEDALSAYLEFESRYSEHWKDIQFLYGLGICYFHFGAFDKAIELFQTILYLQPSCVRAKEIHIRLGYIYKLNINFESSLRHFRQALNDSTKGTFTETEIRFQIAHLLEVCGKYKQAQKAYEQLISYSKEDVSDHIKHLCYRQLGWLHFAGHLRAGTASSATGTGSTNNKVAALVSKRDSIINLLHQAINLDDSSGKTWYLFGRAQAKENKVQEAFMAYRNSIDKTEANADTWCSIGVLYQEQNQPMDALQAYFCACQLNRKHVAAWTNLGVLYESMSQHKEAYKCYQNALSSDKYNEIRPEIKERVQLLQSLLDSSKQLGSNVSPNNTYTHNSQVNASKSNMSGMTGAGQAQVPAGTMKLPTVDEAWNLPIPTELTQRQMQMEMQEAAAAVGTMTTGGCSSHGPGASTNSSSTGTQNNSSRLFAHQLPPYLTQPHDSSSLGADSENNAKRRKIEETTSGSEDGSNFLIPFDNHKENMSNQMSDSRNNSTLLVKEEPMTKQSNDQTGSSNTNQEITKSEPTNDHQPCNQGNQHQNNALANESQDDLNLLDEISEDYDDHDIIFNIDALLNDPMNNFDDTFSADDTVANSNCTTSTMATCTNSLTTSSGMVTAVTTSSSSLVNTKQLAIGDKSVCPSTPGDQLKTTQAEQQPVPDLLVFLKAIDECDEQLLSKHLVYNPIEQFDIRMNGKSIIDKVLFSKMALSTSPGNSNHGGGYHWSITYLPGNRVPKPPSAPPPASSVTATPPGSGSGNQATTTPSGAQSQSADYFQLSPPTPSIYLDNKKDVHSPELRHFCLSQPVVVIRNLAATLRMDLGVFSTKTLVESNPTHKIEQRYQDLQAPDENRDSNGKTVMRCVSARSSTTIQEYANYQAKMFVEAKKEEKSHGGLLGNNGGAGIFGLSQSGGGGTESEDGNKKKRRKIYFGTNCDLSDESKWFTQLHELNKLPSLFKVVSACNMLSHTGFVIQGMNSVQLYMKVPGCRTPGHQENNNFCSVNINVGPGDCEWFAVPEQYWGAVSALCEQHQIDYLSGSWWPNLEELRQHRIPCYRFIQRPGDLVWINSGTVHWVQAIGWCNNIAWNVGPLVSRQYSLSMERYEYNKLRMFTSIVPMVHLSWQLARNIKMTDFHLYQLIKYTLMVSLVQSALIWNYLDKAGVLKLHQPREENEQTQTCVDCESELFNIFLIKPIKTPASISSNQNAANKQKQSNAKYETRCLNCALKFSPTLNNFKAIHQYKLTELIEAYDNFRFQSTPIAAYSVSR